MDRKYNKAAAAAAAAASRWKGEAESTLLRAFRDLAVGHIPRRKDRDMRPAADRDRETCTRWWRGAAGVGEHHIAAGSPRPQVGTRADRIRRSSERQFREL